MEGQVILINYNWEKSIQDVLPLEKTPSNRKQEHKKGEGASNYGDHVS